MSRQPIIRIQGLEKTYHLGDVTVRALRGVNLDIETGSYVAIMGPSGSGKSTMLNLLGCLDQPTAGNYFLGGENVAVMDDEQVSIIRGKRLGFVFQSYNLIPQLTVIENIYVPLFYQGKDLTVCHDHCAHLAALVGLGQRLDHRPKQLSGGQQQRVAIARSLANDPLMILADEPTGNLDSKTGLEILDLMDELNASGKTIVLVTHDEKVADRAHRVIHMKDGVIDRDIINEHRLPGKGAVGFSRPSRTTSQLKRHSSDLFGPHNLSGGEATAAVLDRPHKVSSRSTPDENKDLIGGNDDGANEVGPDPQPKRGPDHRPVAFLHHPIFRIVQLGIKSLLLHKMRSILTMLGIIFGVCSVIAMLAIGEGASYEAQQAIKKLGSSNIILRSLKPGEDNKVSGGQRSFAVEYGLTYKDASSIQSTVPGVKRVLPMRIIRDSVRFNQNNIPSQIIGTHPLYPEIAGVEIVRGRFLTETDETHMENVCVLTVQLAERLFPYQDPLSEEVKVGSDYYQVVGLVRETSSDQKRPQSANPNEGQSLDNNLYIPLSTARSRFGETLIRRSAGSFEAERVQLHQITVGLDSPDKVEPAVLQLQAILQRFHQKKDYEMIVPLQLLHQAAQTKRMFNIVLGSIAAISLLVGGIGIMNIMLATVTERTREIGVRRALGARKKDIITQFLVETMVLSIGGGLIGVVFGVLVPMLVSQLTSMKTVITPSSLVLAFGISGAVGIIFGLYPASRAADLHPIQALRHE